MRKLKVEILVEMQENGVQQLRLLDIRLEKNLLLVH
jgi:hypothetical protein